VNCYDKITQMKIVTHRYKKWNNDTVIITVLKPVHCWFSFTYPFSTLPSLTPHSAVTNLHIFLSLYHSFLSAVGWWLSWCYRCFLSPRPSSRGVCSNILEEHIASMFRVWTSATTTKGARFIWCLHKYRFA